MTVNWAQAFIGALAGTAVVGPLLGDPMKRCWSALADAVFSLQIRNISGKWLTHYWYIAEDGSKNEKNDAVLLKQSGRYVRGKNEGRSDHIYTVNGWLRNNVVLTGTWKSCKNEAVFEGAFQLLVSADGRSMSGKWVGLSNSKPGTVRSGEWHWKKP